MNKLSVPPAPADPASPGRRMHVWLLSLAGIAALVGLTVSALAEPWDNSMGNPYVRSGNGDQCTAYAWGRYEVMNGEALSFVGNPPSAGLMYDRVRETTKTYRDSVPVRGSIASLTKPKEDGHGYVVEMVNADGSLNISEQNWPTHSGPNNKRLPADQVQSRPSTVNGHTTYYTLRGFINPNRPPRFGTLYTSKNGTAMQVQFALMDEDRRPVTLLAAIADGQSVVSGTTISGTVKSNVVINGVFSNTNLLKRGKSYTLHIWATDFLGLRSTTTRTFTW